MHTRTRVRTLKALMNCVYSYQDQCKKFLQSRQQSVQVRWRWRVQSSIRWQYERQLSGLSGWLSPLVVLPGSELQPWEIPFINWSYIKFYYLSGHLNRNAACSLRFVPNLSIISNYICHCLVSLGGVLRLFSRYSYLKAVLVTVFDTMRSTW